MVRQALLITCGAAMGFILHDVLKSREEAEAADGGYIRPAGPASMTDPPINWDAVDEAGDESFPASDPPSR